MGRTESKKTLQTVEHTFDILEAFNSTAPLLSLSELSAKTGLHKSSVYRIVKVLSSRGYLELDRVTKKYSLGLRLVDLASNRINDLELLTEAHTLMLRLHAETSLTTQLCVLDGTDVVYLDEVNSASVRHYTNMGYRGEAYCSSLGKCLLSSLPADELEWRFTGYKFTRYTDTTITSFEKLRAELREIRKQGYAVNRGEKEAILSSVACPIYDYNGNMIAAISLGAASFLLVPETIRNLLPHLQRYAKMISKKMGYPIDISL